MQRDRATCHKYKLEGTQRVHISAKYTIMLWCTRLYVYISTALIIYLRSRRLPMIMTSWITTAWCGVCGKSIGNGVDIFVHFFITPISILNLTMSSESQEKRRFQRYIVRTKIFLTFHARVEYISVFRSYLSGRRQLSVAEACDRLPFPWSAAFHRARCSGQFYLSCMSCVIVRLAILTINTGVWRTDRHTDTRRQHIPR